MKRDNKNNLLIFILLISLSVNFVSALYCDLDVSLLNQNPYPAVPGEYVDAVFQVSGIISGCGGAAFELFPSYPFSIVENDSVKILGGNTYHVTGYQTDWLVPYKLKVDKGALDSNYEIKVRYHSGTSTSWDSYISQIFNLTVQDSRTDFDAVIQEVSGSSVSIAIANVGKYSANSVVVRIPEQENFRVTGTDGQMVGNLASGDYTIVSFSLSSVVQKDYQKGFNRSTGVQQNQASNLKFDIYYTDALGERRIVNMELPISLSSSVNASSGYINGFSRTQAQTSSGINWTALIIVLIIIAAGFVIYKKYPYLKKKFSKKKASNTSNIIPDWVKNVVAQEKKK